MEGAATERGAQPLNRLARSLHALQHWGNVLLRARISHGSVQMSLRYAHLAPDQRREAVAKLNYKPILALTLRSQWQGPQPMCAIRLI